MVDNMGGNKGNLTSNLGQLKRLAEALGVPISLTANYAFMTEFKYFVADVCRFSREGSRLDELFSEKRFDVNEYGKDLLDDSDLDELYNEIKQKHLSPIGLQDAQRYIETQSGKPYDVNATQAMVKDNNHKCVRFQEVRVVGDKSQSFQPKGNHLNEVVCKIDPKSNLFIKDSIHYNEMGVRTGDRYQTTHNSDGKRIKTVHGKYNEGKLSYLAERDVKDNVVYSATYHPDGWLISRYDYTYVNDPRHKKAVDFSGNHYDKDGKKTKHVEGINRDGERVISITYLDESGNITKTEKKKFGKDGKEILPTGQDNTSPDNPTH